MKMVECQQSRRTLMEVVVVVVETVKGPPSEPLTAPFKRLLPAKLCQELVHVKVCTLGQARGGSN